MQAIHSKEHDCALGLIVQFSLAFRFWTVSFALLGRGTLLFPNCFIFYRNSNLASIISSPKLNVLCFQKGQLLIIY